MATYQRRILLVVDGSYQAYETVNYVSGVLPPTGTEIELFHVTSKVPEAFWDLEKDPMWQQKVQTVRGWEVQQEKKIGEFMKRAHQVFVDANFPKSAVKINVRERKEGIARDIGAESHKGYDAVILGRRGLSTIQDLSLGGVASKVVLKVNDLAVWLVGGKPDTDKCIVGIDSSKGSMLAVDHLAKITDGLDKKVLLIHVIRQISDGPEESENAAIKEYQVARMEKAATEIEPILEQASQRLQAGGVKAENISTKVITGASTRAGTILQEARAGGYGTIVVGRRGVSTVEDFDMGRVSNKLVQAAKDRALWVVG
ncbi:MAG: universal stress protein [Syntrophobacteraceae bacterium]